MTVRRLRIEAPSRLHFGLQSFGQTSGCQYGGVGLMVESPGLCLLAEATGELSASGPAAARLLDFAKRWHAYVGRHATTGFRLRLLRSAPQHAGLGTGTQLGLSVAALLYQMNGYPMPDAVTLAASVGRGLRSSIGTHGFLHGGLIVDRGKAAGQSLGQLTARIELPAGWRVVQIRPLRHAGLSGSVEKQAFGQLPSVPLEVTGRLERRINEELIPAARAADFERFSEAVYAYGYEAGMCFATIQGGPYATTQLAEWVAALRGRGVLGVGQSSWGPTVYAFTANSTAADELVGWLQRDVIDSTEVSVCVSRIANHGARCHAMKPEDDRRGLDP